MAPIDVNDFKAAAEGWVPLPVSVCGSPVTLNKQSPVSSAYVEGAFAGKGNECANGFVLANADVGKGAKKAGKASTSAGRDVGGTAASASVIGLLACLLVVIAVIVNRRRSRVLSKRAGNGVGCVTFVRLTYSPVISILGRSSVVAVR
jgi:hypothetical protein